MKKKVLSFWLAVIMLICFNITCFNVTAGAENTVSIQFNIFGCGEKEFFVTTDKAGTSYSVYDAYREDHKNNPIGLSCTAGIIGHPVYVNLDRGSEDMKAEIKFRFDYQLLRGAEQEQMTIAKYDVDRKRMVLLDTEVEEFEHTVTAHTAGSGFYTLVDIEKWYEAWKTGQLIIRDPVVETNHFNVIFAIDTSGSMYGSRNDLSRKCTYRFMSQLTIGDRFSVVGFSNSARTVIKNRLIKKTTNMEDFEDIVMDELSDANGGTNFDAALREALNHTTDEKYYTNLIVFLSDGEASINDSILLDVIKQNAYIASIGLETGSSEVLEYMASETGGRYYEATTGNITEIFDDIKDEYVGVPIEDDNDNDSIPNKVEEEGMRTRFGQIITTNMLKLDTDGDGFADGSEIGDVIIDEDVSEQDKEYGLGRYVFFSFFSDPSNPDDTPENSIVNDMDNIVHIYDQSERDVKIDLEKVSKVSNKSMAEKYFTEVIKSLDAEQRDSSMVVYTLSLLEDELISKADSISYLGRNSIHISDATISSKVNRLNSIEDSLDKILKENNIEKVRKTRKYVTIITDEDKEIKIDKDVLSDDILGVKVVTPFACIRLDSDKEEDVVIRNEGTTEIEYITCQKVGVYFDDDAPEATPAPTPKTSSARRSTPSPTPKATATDAPNKNNSEARQNDSVTLSIPNLNDITAFSNIVSEEGAVTISKYNTVTGMEEARLNKSGIYYIEQNRVEFDDLKGKPAEMKTAIRNLTAQRIVEGKGEGIFSPDEMITRAQAATLMVRMLSALDPNEDGEFDDVKRTDWFFGAAGSSKKHGIITGYEDNTFRGNQEIPKVQLLTVEARTLKAQMGYDDVKDSDKYLSKYTDSLLIPGWAYDDIAFAKRENLILNRIDGSFSGDSILARGDVAIEIYRLFEKWIP